MLFHQTRITRLPLNLSTHLYTLLWLSYLHTEPSRPSSVASTHPTPTIIIPKIIYSTLYHSIDGAGMLNVSLGANDGKFIQFISVMLFSAAIIIFEVN